MSSSQTHRAVPTPHTTCTPTTLPAAPWFCKGPPPQGLCTVFPLPTVFPKSPSGSLPCLLQASAQMAPVTNPYPEHPIQNSKHHHYSALPLSTVLSPPTPKESHFLESRDLSVLFTTVSLSLEHCLAHSSKQIFCLINYIPAVPCLGYLGYL